MLSLYRNAMLPTPIGSITIEELYQSVQGDQMKKSEITNYRNLLTEKGKKSKQVGVVKRNLSAFTACELKYRDLSEDNLLSYSGQIIIDIDDITISEIETLRNKLSEYPDVICGFISPSENGYKVIHQTKYDSQTSVQQHHYSAYIHYERFYKEEFGHEIDPSCKDYTRLCFISSDDKCYYQENPVAKDIEILSIDSTESESTKDVKAFEDDDRCRESVQVASFSYYNYNRPSDQSAEGILCSITDFLEKSKENIVEEYHNWISVCYALKNTFSEDRARYWWHQLSKQDYQQYSSQECHTQFDACELRTKDGAGLGTVVYLAKEKGFQFNSQSAKKHRRELVELHFIQSLVRYNLKLRYNFNTDALEYNTDTKVRLKSKDEDFNKGGVYWKQLRDVDLDVIRYEVFGGLYDKENLISRMRSIAPNYNILTEFKKEIANVELEPNVDYIELLGNTIDSETSNELKNLMLRKWLVGLVAEIHNPFDVQNENILVFQGAQGIGKTRWSYKLLPHKYQSLLLNKNINPKDKDDKLELTRKMIVFMDEMDAVVNTKSSVESLKSITSQRVIEERAAYARVTDRKPKIDSFLGCINNHEFLRDTTGNRRFFIIKTNSLDYLHEVDMMKVFSYALKLFNEGYEYWLSKEERELLEENNKEFEVQTDEENLIRKWLRPSTTSFHSVTDIKTKINALEGESVLKYANNLGKYLKKCGFNNGRKTIDGTQKRGYMCEFREVDEIDISS